MSESILNSVKQGIFGITDDYTAFDPQIILHINGVFSTLNQLGVGPEDGFSITGDSETWSDFLGTNEQMLEFVKQYTTMKVKILFDPPSSSFVLSSLEKEAEKLEWRIAVMVDTINNK